MEAHSDELVYVEAPALELLGELGWETVSAFSETFGPDGTLGRDSQSDVVLVHRLREALTELNPNVPVAGIDVAVDELVRTDTKDKVRANKRIHLLLRDGFPVQVENSDGISETVRVRFVDWDNPNGNKFLAVSQLWVQGPLYLRRPDVLLFVNGIPLVFTEFKAPHVNVKNAFDENLSDYRDSIPELFRFNGFALLSNGTDTKIGSTYAGWEYFAEWKKVASESEQGVVSLETALRGLCTPTRLLDYVSNFVAYVEMPGGLIKAVAKNHQYLGVNNAMEAIRQAKELDGKLGVFWHTQGSGKSLSMLWFTQKVLRTRPGNWTFVMVTDRKELDEQLYKTFADADVITTGTNVHAETSAHLRELLTTDQRYVFTLIHKFIPAEGGAEMPVLSERDDIVVITDEAHRSQYDTLAMNMRKALPNASFLGFTGTPLIDSQDELTRQVFGEYVSIYNFRDSIEDKATVPLYYQNRIPELQLENEDFSTELETLLEDANLDPDQEVAISRQFNRQYQLITRSERLDTIAEDVVNHFVNRGYRGKAMYVAIDKATAVKMYDLVDKHWKSKLVELQQSLSSTPLLEQAPIQRIIDFMESTDRAVVVSQAQNELADMKAAGLDITPHRQRINKEDLDSKFKDPEDPFRLVFVCAMWLTGFDAPSCSTLYLDKPMRNHTLMQTIARANRVFAGKDNGLIVDYVGVFRNLEKALSVYGGARIGDGPPDTPARDINLLISNLDLALAETNRFLTGHNINLTDLETATGFEFLQLQASAAETLLINNETRRQYITLAATVRSAYKALLPEPQAHEKTRQVSAVRAIAKKIASKTEAADIGDVMDSVSELLDRSVGAKEYVIRLLAESDKVVDLSTINFEELVARFGANKRTAVHTAQLDIQQRLNKALTQNPTRHELAKKFEELIDDYNAGTHNIEEILRRLKELSDKLTQEQQRAIREGVTEAELAIFDLLTKPEPQLTETERTQVRKAAKALLDAITERLVLDWQRHSQTRAEVQVTIGKTLDQQLPDVYNKEIYDRKVDAIFKHICETFGDDGTSPYDHTPQQSETPNTSKETTDLNNLDTIDEQFLARAKKDPKLFAELMHRLLGAGATWMTPTTELLGDPNAENRNLEFKQTARWNVNEQRKDKRMEDVIVKTVAGFLNGQGGTLLIGVNDHGEPVNLDNDYALVKPSDADGYVSWLDTMLQNQLGHAGSHRVKIKVETINNNQICRVDVPASSRPIWTTNKNAEVLYERRNNSTRAVPEEETETFIKERFSGLLQTN